MLPNQEKEGRAAGGGEASDPPVDYGNPSPTSADTPVTRRGSMHFPDSPPLLPTLPITPQAVPRKGEAATKNLFKGFTRVRPFAALRLSVTRTLTRVHLSPVDAAFIVVSGGTDES